MALAAVLAVGVGACSSDDTVTSSTSAEAVGTETSSSEGTGTTAAADPSIATDHALDPAGAYGDPYADGLLPVGDGRYSLDAPQQGSLYLCNELGGEAGGADERGPWFVNDDTEYDLNQKITVGGEIYWEGEHQMQVDGEIRRITTNDLPGDHPTGEFPIEPSDPAYEYDRNPNSIEEQDLVYELPAQPTLADEPTCMGGESGVMNTGVALFNAFDAGNRDAGAWEVQDSCDGHPQISGEYHYHTLSSCIDDVDVSTIVGWALDGFPITGPKVSSGNVLTTDDLDECHGITSTLEIDGESVTTYHYVMTEDFPYSVSCFRGDPIDPPQVMGAEGFEQPGGVGHPRN